MGPQRHRKTGHRHSAADPPSRHRRAPRRGRAKGRAEAAPKAAQPPGPLAMPPDARSIGAVASGQDGQPDRRGQADLDRQDGGQGTQGPRGGQLGRASRAGIVVARPFGIPVHVSPYWFVIAGRLHRHLRQRPEQLAARQRQVRGRGRLRGAAVPVRAGARAGPLGRRARLRPAGAPHPAVSRSAASPRSTRSRRPRPGSSCVSAAGPALSLALGGAGWALTLVVKDGVSGSLVRQLMYANIIVGDLQPAARAAAGRRPDAARRHLEDHR